MWFVKHLKVKSSWMQMCGIDSVFFIFYNERFISNKIAGNDLELTINWHNKQVVASKFLKYP